ncbi:MAG TPA: hypothetical protein VGJ04_07815, partial [Pirellulales bacterium]
KAVRSLQSRAPPADTNAGLTCEALGVACVFVLCAVDSPSRRVVGKYVEPNATSACRYRIEQNELCGCIAKGISIE